MAANDGCPCTEGRYAETEMLAREFVVWPMLLVVMRWWTKPASTEYLYPASGPDDRAATFRLRPGLDYWLRQGAVTVYVSADADSVEVE